MKNLSRISPNLKPEGFDNTIFCIFNKNGSVERKYVRAYD